MKKISAFLLAALMVAALLPVMSFAEADLTITTADGLVAFADAVNGGNNYAGKTVVLGANIDLAGVTWTPIGNTQEKAFKGTFDGQDYTISNLTVNLPAAEYVGLFGRADSATIKNVKIKNATVTGSSMVGALAGCAYTGVVENCHLSGNIDIDGNYDVGGLTGYSYAKFTNCSVIGTGSVTGTYKEADLEGDNVGGMIGYRGEGPTIVTTGCVVEGITVVGTRKVGGVIGSAFQNNKITDCSVSDIVVGTNATVDYANSKKDSMAIGGIVGLTSKDYTGGSLTGNSVDGLTFTNANNVTVTADPIIGGHRGTEAPVKVENMDTTGNTMASVTGSTVNNTGAEDVTPPAYAGPVMNWVKVNAADNGVVKSGPLAASAGATITLYPKAAEGYVLDTVSVLDAEGNAVALDGLKFAIPAGGVTVSATFKLAE